MWAVDLESLAEDVVGSLVRAETDVGAVLKFQRVWVAAEAY